VPSATNPSTVGAAYATGAATMVALLERVQQLVQTKHTLVVDATGTSCLGTGSSSHENTPPPNVDWTPDLISTAKAQAISNYQCSSQGGFSTIGARTSWVAWDYDDQRDEASASVQVYRVGWSAAVGSYGNGVRRVVRSYALFGKGSNDDYSTFGKISGTNGQYALVASSSGTTGGDVALGDLIDTSVPTSWRGSRGSIGFAATPAFALQQWSFSI